MATAAFDSREAYHRLREGGMDEPAANAVVEILSPFVTQDFLRAELANVHAEVRADLANVQANVRADLAQFQLRIVTFVAALNVGIATVAVAVAALLT